MTQNLIQKILPDVFKEDVQAAISGVGGQFLKTLDAETQVAILEAIIGAIQNVFILGIAAGCLAIWLSIFIDRKPIDLTQSSVEKTDEREVVAENSL